MKDLILIRGLPGAGKTTIADLITKGNRGENEGFNICTDEFFERYNNGEFDPELLDEAHNWTEERVKSAMDISTTPIVVHNTFTQRWEWEEYTQMAEEHGYRVHHIICEKRHDGESTSDVPQKTIDRMESRFQIRLQ